MAMDDYISRKDAEIALCNYLGATSVRASCAAKCIMNPVPAADVRENVHAKWDKSGAFPVCTACGAGFHLPFEFDFCYHCGAIMDA